MASGSASASASPLPAASSEDDLGKVLQFTIKLDGTKVWRKLQVPESYTLYGLHVAIQDSFGWLDYHLHEFKVKNPTNGKSLRAGIPSKDDFDFGGGKLYASWKVPLAKYFKEGLTSYKTDYMYDFGDGWAHSIHFEGTFPAEPGKLYPTCIDGKMKGPPEDCGGVHGYKRLLKNLKKNANNRTEDEKEVIDWLHENMATPDYDPDHFVPSGVWFDCPEGRLRYVAHD